MLVNTIYQMHHFTAPLCGTLFYMYVSQMLKMMYIENPFKHSSENMKSLCESCFRGFSIAHNALLSGFSGYICASLLKVVMEQGMVIKSVHFMSQPDIKNLILWFYLSKYYEYFDTFLLYMKGRNPIFLQKYHHVGAVICWHLCYIYDVDMIIYGTILNSGIHTVMYAYYLATLFKWDIRSMRMYITSGQMIQLATGVIMGAYYYRPPIESWENYSVILFFNVYIAGLMYMFGEFMVNNYWVKKNAVKEA